MTDENRTREGLLCELSELRQRIAESEKAEAARCRAETALRESETNFRTLAENANDGILIAGGEGIHVYANRRAAQITGYTVAELLEMGIKELASPDELPQIMEQYKARLEGKPVPVQYETAIVRKDGQDVPIEVTGARAVWRGEPVDIVVIRDFSQRKRAEEQLREKDVLLKEIHHRVKNNLQIIISLLELQCESVEDPDVLKVLEESSSRVKSMAIIHEHLYRSPDLARIDAAEYVPELVQHLLGVYRGRAGGVTMDIEVSDVLLDVDTAVPCGLIITELVSNALEHAFVPDQGPREEKIQVEMYLEDDQVTLVVSDNGVGLPTDVAIQQSGSLGLQLVDILTRQLQGTITADSAASSPGGSGGTTFRITFSQPT